MEDLIFVCFIPVSIIIVFVLTIIICRIDSWIRKWIRKRISIIIDGVDSWISELIKEKKERTLQERLMEIESLPVPILLKNIKDEDILFRHKKEKLPSRLKAIQVLGYRGDPSAVEPLIHLLSDDNPMIRWEAITALGNLGDPRAMEPLMKALHDTSAFSKAKEALVKLGVPPAKIHSSGKVFPDSYEEIQTVSVEELIMKLEDKDWQVRWKAAEALGRTDDARAVEPLIKTLKDEDWSVRLKAAEASGQIDDARVVEPLVNMLKDDNTEVCRAIGRILGTIGEPAIKPLIGLLESKEPSTRKEAVKVLGNIRNDRVIEPLIRALGEQDQTVRKEAVKVLGSIRDNRVIEPLIRSLGDRDVDVHREVVKVLKEIGVPVVQHLAKAVESNDENVQWRAIEALRTLSVITPLLKITDDKDRKVREHVMEILKKAFVSVDTVIFREGEFRNFDQSTRLINPEVPKLTITMSELKRVVIYTETYDFHQVERFMTYAVNYIGQKHLKKHVEVHIYGDPEKLHPNLRNTFKNLCKSVEVYEREEYEA